MNETDSTARTARAGTPPVNATVHVRGARLAYSDEGSGPAVVHGHGLLQSRATERASGMFDWAPVVAAGRRLVRYDARGHGESTGTSTPSSYTWPQLADDLLALLDQVVGPEPVSGIGCSLGTATLLHAAVREPGRFDRLVLTAPPTAWASRAAQAELYRLAADLAQTHGYGALAEFAARSLAAAALADLPAPPGHPSAPAVGEDLLPTVLRAAAASDLPAEQDLTSLDLPVLILAWAGDPGHPVSTAERLAELIAGSRLHVAESGAQLRQWGVTTARFLAPAAASRRPAGHPAHH
ncbi:alpha/beta fold hydrolase [Frankia sp. AgKG'84/4]|uniref:alpha/beta fold hydrolase n=1 Tax=Frankia sp. AgKG'84/4 TaxID=573490 RepID=UPI00200FB3C8|nr:alpha/beta hydrolase [Frankia sp. AgKG'84/4]MCL9793359.1 alpha/beta hydrolase [Frankia sp. AgKG'84/4]